MGKGNTNITEGSAKEASQDSGISSAADSKAADHSFIHHTRDLVHKAGHYVHSYGLMAGSFVLGVAVAVIVVRKIARRVKR